MKPTLHTLHKFFTISNLIEGVEDNDEVLKQIELFVHLLDQDEEISMYFFHTKMWHLNSYCKPGKLRTYDVFVWGKKCMHPSNIGPALFNLFLEVPKTYKEIKQWHIYFEKIHGFWDWNWRTWRFLMLRQLLYNNIPIPQIFLSIKNFHENRKRYYRWFD